MSESRVFISEGHLIDSGILAPNLSLIIEEGADYNIIDFKIGKSNLQVSRIELDVLCNDSEHLSDVTAKLVEQGCFEKRVHEVDIRPSEKDGTAPEDFYSTTNHRTEVFYDRAWRIVENQRMDAVVVIDGDRAICKKIREVSQGDLVVCGSESIRVHPPERSRQSDNFGFMTGEVSSERSVDVAVEQLAEELDRCRREGLKVVAVAGPVVVHAGGADAVGFLIREGYIHGLLSGNALAVHDIESVLFGTSLGLDLKTGRPSAGGHRNHMRAINRIRRHGSIHNAVESGDVDRGIMYETIRSGIPYCLAGSIRDDGPLPETINDMIESQRRYGEILEGSEIVMMLSTMLHSIGVGNMTPSWVTTVCVDINPAVVTKLTDRGSSQTIGIVSDVGFVLRALASRLEKRGNT